MLVFTRNQAKAKADSLRKYLSEKGITLPASDLLNAIARMAGCEDWNAMAAQFSGKAVDALLLDIEQESAANSVADAKENAKSGTRSWGPECQIQTASGFWLVMPDTDDVSYVRVCDPLGREVVYWSVDEFTESAGLVLGALAGALNRGRSDVKPDPVNPSADKLVVADKSGRQKRASSKRMLSELPWDDLCSVLIQEPGEELEEASRYRLHNPGEVDVDLLDALDAEREGTADDEDIEALELSNEQIIIDWGDQYESEGLDMSELRHCKAGPGTAWTLNDGRILRFFRYEAV